MWNEMVIAVRELETCLGDGVKRVEKNETESQIVQRRAARVNKNIESLPNGLNIKNLFSLPENPNLKYLPNDIKIGGNLWLSNTGIENLPKNLKINGDISLNNTPLAKKYDNNPNEIRKVYPNIKGKIFI